MGKMDIFYSMSAVKLARIILAGHAGATPAQIRRAVGAGAYEEPSTLTIKKIFEDPEFYATTLLQAPGLLRDLSQAEKDDLLRVARGNTEASQRLADHMLWSVLRNRRGW